AEDCYQAFKEMGIDYGEGHRGIREIYLGKNQILARLSLPSSLKETQSEYVLHPSLMDAALQSSIGLMLKHEVLPDGSKSVSSGSEVPLKPSYPFVLKSLEIFAPCTSEMYAWVRNSGGSAPPDKVQNLDIDICDEQGNVCVKLRALSYQKTDDKVKSVTAYLTKWEFLTTNQRTVVDGNTHLSVDEKIDLFLRQTVASQIQNTMDQIQEESTFFELGLSSSGVVVLVKETEKIIGRELSPTLLFEYVSIKELGKYLKENYFTEFKTVVVRKRKIETKQYQDSSNYCSQIQQLAPYGRKTRSIYRTQTEHYAVDQTVLEILLNIDRGILSLEEGELVINEMF
ncbi:MAG: hypothetical protein GY941_08220, partial [Planctomycetes bacterium]|nr:hypothetical protein [Planctomycetota bacterium]